MDGIVHPSDLVSSTVSENLPQPAFYSSDFFKRYQPINAMDMVKMLPGFQAKVGDESRGLGGAIGNILVNGRRPTSKQDTVSDILGRIPAGRVSRIEMVRVGDAAIDMGGHSLVANIVLRADAPAAITWQLLARKNFQHGPITPEGKLSLVDSWGALEYTAGLIAKRFAYGERGPRLISSRAGNVTERWLDNAHTAGVETVGNFGVRGGRASALFRLNTEFGCDGRERRQRSHGNRQGAGVDVHDVHYGVEEHHCHLEIGADVEQAFGSNAVGKAIVLFGYNDRSIFDWEKALAADGQSELYTTVDTDRSTSERIARFEFDWNGISNHAMQVNLEIANNYLENELIRSTTTGSGLALIPIPGANVAVEETRINLLLKDTWTVGDYTLGVGIGGETSRLSQHGDVNSVRRFSFLKPSFVLTRSSTFRDQLRLRIAREVSQLNFNYFVSENNFEDDDLSLGNPELRPETTWLAELSFRRRFGSIGTFRIMGFHHWISDVEDLLPISSNFEVTGNIGDGHRWGTKVESTLPLDAVGLDDARLDVEAYWQNSSVRDPVTERQRRMSDEREYDVAIDYRQDFLGLRSAWGFHVRLLAERPLFKVNELDTYIDRPQVNAYIETTRWLGMKIRLSIDDLLNLSRIRHRRVFAARRYLSPLSFREFRDRTGGRRLTVSISGVL